MSHHQDARRYRPGHPAIVSHRSCLDVDSGPVRRPTLSQLGASRAGETHRAEWAYDHHNVLDAPHPWTVHRDRGAVAWRLNPQPAPRDQRGGATRRSRDRWRLLRLELVTLLRAAPQRTASRPALRPGAGIPRLRFARIAAVSRASSFALEGTAGAHPSEYSFSTNPAPLKRPAPATRTANGGRRRATTSRHQGGRPNLGRVDAGDRDPRAGRFELVL